MEARPGNGEAAGPLAHATYRRRAEDHQEIAARNLALDEFEVLRPSHPIADAFFAALDVYCRELSYIAVRWQTTSVGGGRRVGDRKEGPN